MSTSRSAQALPLFSSAKMMLHLLPCLFQLQLWVIPISTLLDVGQPGLALQPRRNSATGSSKSNHGTTSSTSGTPPNFGIGGTTSTSPQQQNGSWWKPSLRHKPRPGGGMGMPVSSEEEEAHTADPQIVSLQSFDDLSEDHGETNVDGSSSSHTSDIKNDLRERELELPDRRSSVVEEREEVLDRTSIYDKPEVVVGVREQGRRTPPSSLLEAFLDHGTIAPAAGSPSSGSSHTTPASSVKSGALLETGLFWKPKLRHEDEEETAMDVDLHHGTRTRSSLSANIKDEVESSALGGPGHAAAAVQMPPSSPGGETSSSRVKSRTSSPAVTPTHTTSSPETSPTSNMGEKRYPPRLPIKKTHGQGGGGGAGQMKLQRRNGAPSSSSGGTTGSSAHGGSFHGESSRRPSRGSYADAVKNQTATKMNSGSTSSATCAGEASSSSPCSSDQEGKLGARMFNKGRPQHSPQDSPSASPEPIHYGDGLSPEITDNDPSPSFLVGGARYVPNRGERRELKRERKTERECAKLERGFTAVEKRTATGDDEEGQLVLKSSVLSGPALATSTSSGSAAAPTAPTTAAAAPQCFYIGEGSASPAEASNASGGRSRGGGSRYNYNYGRNLHGNLQRRRGTTGSLPQQYDEPHSEPDFFTVDLMGPEQANVPDFRWQ
ncbi:unnamed protein product [Amoebophrya sp. A25]|nr:unnamed protein product [Amoebophrya sp. A25]|eukprot:GSA25T00014645001.1